MQPLWSEGLDRGHATIRVVLELLVFISCNLTHHRVFQDQEPGGRGRHSSRNRTGQGLGSTDLPVQRRQPRRAQSRLVVPLEQPEASSSDGKEPAQGSDADGLRAIRKYNR